MPNIRRRGLGGLRNESGITGLETSIILIAFVVVASVFAYAVLSAGLFTADKSKEAVNAGIDLATSSLEIMGSMKADGQTPTVLSNVEKAWTPSVNVTSATETSDRKQGTASTRLTIAEAFASGLVAYETASPSVDLTSHFAAGLWIKAATATTDGTFQLLLDDSPACDSPLESLDIPALKANTWTNVRMNLTDPTALGSLACAGINAPSDPGSNELIVDLVQGPAEVQKVHLALANTIPSEGIAFLPQADANGDGLLSDEPDQQNRVVVSYLDQESLLRDLAWTTTELGRGDGDISLEAGETFLFTIDLRAVDPIPTARTLMTFHIAPNGDSSLTLEKRVPANITTSMILN
ncbi:MAG: archaellin/type IV pilin N-terminal domain-containing protein [Dehalococcoidia bacterium]